MTYSVILFVAIAMWQHLCCCQGVENPVVTTEFGSIKGVTVAMDEGTVDQFLGIPFAYPPVGLLRFQTPKPINTSWVGKLDVTEYGPSCMQMPEMLQIVDPLGLLPNKDVSEDCLQLNVYVPRDLNPGIPKSVMVWIHGGGFIMGQASFYDMSKLALRGDVIAVGVNYRLGAFGFLSTGDAAMRGNYGLWDQRLAIQWVRDNIAAFGGDPKSITIFGESAGGMSVGLQSISPANEGLFQRAIGQSGSGTDILIVKDNVPFVIDVAKALGCADEAVDAKTFDSFAAADCLRKQDAIDIQNVSMSRSQKFHDELRGVMAPVLDDELIPELPSRVMSDANSKGYQTFKAIDFMAGTTDDEGGVFTMAFKIKEAAYIFNMSLGLPKDLLCKEFGPAITKAQFEDNKEVAQALCEYYSVNYEGQGGEDASVEQGKRIVDFISDYMFVSPAVKQLQAHAGIAQPTGSTYQYLFTRRPANHLLESFIPRPDWLQGANHGDELPFLLKFKANEKLTLTEEEFDLADQVIDYWTNFAKSGNPNGASLPQWPAYDVESKQYMRLDMKISADKNLYPGRMKLWLKDIPEIMSRKQNKKIEL